MSAPTAPRHRWGLTRFLLAALAAVCLLTGTHTNCTFARDSWYTGGQIGGTATTLLATSGIGGAASGGSSALRGIDEVLGGLSKGRQSFIRTAPDEASLNRIFAELTEGGTPTTWKDFNGTVIERGDGVQVGLRGTSRSGGATVDIRMPDGKIYKIHVDQ